MRKIRCLLTGSVDLERIARRQRSLSFEHESCEQLMASWHGNLEQTVLVPGFNKAVGNEGPAPARASIGRASRAWPRPMASMY